jgi:hypothetical protein
LNCRIRGREPRQATCPVLTVPSRAGSTSKLLFKRIICPVDFSDSSVAALDFAFSLAQEADAELTPVYVFEWSSDDQPLAGPKNLAPATKILEPRLVLTDS